MSTVKKIVITKRPKKIKVSKLLKYSSIKTINNGTKIIFNISKSLENPETLKIVNIIEIIPKLRKAIKPKVNLNLEYL
mgnify:CR=1 FL=1